MAHVVRASAAEKVGIRSGDCLVSAEGVSLEGKGLADDMEALRGIPGESLNLEILRGTEIFPIQVRRERLLAQDTGVMPSPAQSPSRGDWRALDEVDFPGVSAKIYAENDASKKFSNLPNLEHFDRNFISFDLKKAGKSTLRLFLADGKHIRTLRLDGIPGRNTFSWDGSPYPAGKYLVEVECGGETLHFKGILR